VRRQEHDQRREQARRAAPEEAPHADPAAAVDLGQQQGGDEEARQNKEDVDAQEAALQRPELVAGQHELPDVGAEHGEDGGAAQPVERRPRPEAGRGGGRAGTRERRGHHRWTDDRPTYAAWAGIGSAES
jgi:hypothetical protein